MTSSSLISDGVLAALPGAIATISVGVLTLIGGGIAAAWVGGKLTRSVKISEFRQKWIEELRADIATFLGVAHIWIRTYEEFNDLPMAEKVKFESEKVRPVQNEALVVLYRIRMRINPLDNSPTKQEDAALLKALLDLLDPGKLSPQSYEGSWMALADAAVLQARKILKREWEVTKYPLRGAA